MRKKTRIKIVSVLSLILLSAILFWEGYIFSAFLSLIYPAYAIGHKVYKMNVIDWELKFDDQHGSDYDESVEFPTQQQKI